MKKKNTKRILYWVTVVFLSLVILVCAVLIARKLIDDHRNKELLADLAASRDAIAATASRPTIPPTDTTEGSEVTVPSTEATQPVETEPTEPSILLEYQGLYELNNDMVGWIEIPGTEINYPVVQSLYQANFYLRRNFYKEDATCGTIYVREACDVYLPTDNVTLYGHNMRNGTMFADLHEYEEREFWENNRYIYFDNLYEYHTYEIFAVFITTADLTEGFHYHTFDTAADAAEFDEFVATCKDLSLYDTGITPQYGDKLLTLSTCDKSVSDGRLVVVARRVI